MTQKLERLFYLGSPGQTQPAESARTQSAKRDKTIPRNNCFLLRDKAKCWMIRSSDIFTLEACGNYTRVHLSSAMPLVRSSLQECERRLDPSLFFHASHDCIVNLGRVRQARIVDPFRVVFVLQDDREIIASDEQSLIFRKSRQL
jgi:DNA-binding LytR/AlgR family response regulator